MKMSSLELAALAGAATGLRSTVGMAALINAGVPGLPRQLTGRVAKVAASLGAAGELVADKLPSAPDRLAAGLGGRTVLAAAAGAVLARGAKDPLLPAVVVAAAVALLSARIGHDARAAASKRMPPTAAAMAEDMVALGLAAASARS